MSLKDNEYYCKQINEIDNDCTLGEMCDFCLEQVNLEEPLPPYCPYKE